MNDVSDVYITPKHADDVLITAQLPIYLKGRPALKFNLAPARLKEHRTLVYHEEKKNKHFFTTVDLLTFLKETYIKLI